MKVQEIASLFHLNKQTIRYYRDQGLLKPKQKENKYFDYNINDLCLLYHILYLRNTNFTIDEIRSQCNDLEYYQYDRLEAAKKHIDELDLQIQKLLYTKNAIKKTIEYRQNRLQHLNKVEFVPQCEGLYYLKEDYFKLYPNELDRLLNCCSTYQSLIIPLYDFLDSSVTIYHPIYAIGFTESNYQIVDTLKNCNIKVYQKIVHHQPALRFLLNLNDISALSASLFEPVKIYAQENNFQFCNDITSIILTVANEPEFTFYVLFRFIVQKAE